MGLHTQSLLLQCCRWEPTNQLPQSAGQLKQRKGRAACSLPAETKPFYSRDKCPTCSRAWGLGHSPSPSRGRAHHMRAGHWQGRNRARADSALLGPSAGPPPFRAVISLLEVGWGWNPSAQAEAIISPAQEEERPPQQSGPGSCCTSRQRKGRSRHGHVLREP